MKYKSNCFMFSNFLGAIILTVLLPVSVYSEVLNKHDKKELVYLVKQDCGSCHGMTLKGGLGPSLLSKDMQAKGEVYLTHVVKFGLEGTPMPPWKEILTDQEIDFIVNYLLHPEKMEVAIK